MPITPTYPGVYVEEIPSGVHTIVGVATSITAFVGWTAKGPVNSAVHIFNFGDFERQLGGINRDSDVSYAVQQFFLNGGSEAYVVRVAAGVKTSDIIVTDDFKPARDSLKIQAASPGVWGNNLRVQVDYATSNPDSTFNLTVTRYEQQDGKLVAAEAETFRNLSMSSGCANFVEGVVGATSKLIKITRVPKAADFTDTGYSITGSLKSFPALTASENTLTGLLEGSRQFQLTLNNPPAITDADKLVTALGQAITAAGLASDLKVERTGIDGVASTTGDYVKLTSLSPSGKENSSVQVFPGDAATKLKFGLTNGGREKEGASFRRPAQTGTRGDDMGGISAAINNPVKLAIRDEGAATNLFPVAAIGNLKVDKDPDPATMLKNAASALQKLLTINANEFVAKVKVSVVGTTLVATLNDERALNASLRFSDTGSDAVGLTNGWVNVQQYWVGAGAQFGAQKGVTSGFDGSAPGAGDIIGDYDTKAGMYALRDVDMFNLLVIPSATKFADDQAKAIIAAATAFCTDRRAMLLVDPPASVDWTSVSGWAGKLGASRNAALFFPWVLFPDSLQNFRPIAMPPSGAVAGVFARTDAQRGVWKAPAGIDAVVNGAQGLSYTLTDQENGTLNQLAVNCIRTFPVYGTIVWGARTMRGADQLTDEYKYIPVRRVALFLEESLYRGLKWVVFEPNDEPLWGQIRLNIGAFMQDLFRQGAFQGTTPREAYFVKCDKETTTQYDVDRGIVNVVVGFAPLKPAEFVILRIQQMAGRSTT